MRGVIVVYLDNVNAGAIQENGTSEVYYYLESDIISGSPSLGKSVNFSYDPPSQGGDHRGKKAIRITVTN